MRSLPCIFNPNYGILKNKSKLRNDLFEFELIHQHGVWLPISMLSSNWKQKTGRPLIIQPHGYFEEYSMSQSRFKKKISYYLFERKNIELCDLLIACSNSEYETLRKLFPDKDIAIISNGVEKSFLTQKSKNDYFKDHKYKSKKNLLFLSRIHPLKGLERLFIIFSKINKKFKMEWNLIIAGSGEKTYLNKLKDLAVSLNISENIFFEGPIYGSQKVNIISSSDLFVLPTFSENFGIVIAESLSRGVPVITTKAAPWKILNERNCGLWVDNTSEGIYKGLETAFNWSDDEILTIKNNCIKFSKENFLWENIVPNTIELYEWLLKENKKMPNFVKPAINKTKSPNIFKI